MQAKTHLSKPNNTDLLDICRTCLKGLLHGNTISIYNTIETDFANNTNMENNQTDVDKHPTSVHFFDMITLCASDITITSDDGFSNRICGECSDKLRLFHEFRQQIVNCDKIMRNQCASMTNDKNGCFSQNVDEQKFNNIEQECKTDEEPNIGENEQNSCIVCRRVFSSKNRLRIHLVKKHPVRSDEVIAAKHQCQKCEKSYTTRANLLIHERLHSGSKSFKCLVCNREFYKESALKNHTSIHTGLKEFKCTECGRCFTTANILQRHRKKHSPERPHKCSACPKAFYTPNDLRIHFRMHSREQPYLCCQCGKRFARKTHLNIHLRLHSGVKPFNCQFCNKSFALSGDLTAHIRIHTGEKPYECRFCQKTFNQSSARNIHMKIHTGNRNYICQICNATFTQSASLKRHMKCHINFDSPKNSEIENIV